MKSFRAAGQHIVRQGASTPADVMRLLGSASRPARTVASEQDGWDVRLAALAALGEYDAVAFLASKPMRLVHSHNLSDPTGLQGSLGEAVEDVGRSGAAIQLRSPVALADGRVATTILVAPLATIERVEGVLVALRVGRGFGAADAVRAASVSELLAVEVTRAAADRQDTRTRREALALFELTRIGHARRELGERLQTMVEMLASSLGHDVAQLWLLRGGGSLRLRAAHPGESLVLEIARPRDHATLARALAGEVFRVNDPSLRSWVRRTTRELIVAPLHAGDDVTGLLVLGRWREGFVDDDLEMAALCADFVAEIVAADARDRGATASGAHADDAEDSLTGS